MPSYDVISDQAATVRGASKNRQARVLTVTAGKGGVGKSSISINLALALQSQGNKVVILDGDLGLANIDVMLGLYAKKTIEDVLFGECHLNDILLQGPKGIQIIPSVSGIETMASLSKQQHAGLIDAFNELACEMDYLIIDTAAGISDSVLSFIRSSQEVLVVVCDEPTSIMDAYALIKIMHKHYKVNRFNIVSNFTKSNNEGAGLFKKLYRVSEKFLDVSLNYLGDVPYDSALPQGIRLQKPAFMSFPKAKATQAFSQLANQVDNLAWSNFIHGNTGFFLQRMVNE